MAAPECMAHTLDNPGIHFQKVFLQRLIVLALHSPAHLVAADLAAAVVVDLAAVAVAAAAAVAGRSNYLLFCRNIFYTFNQAGLGIRISLI